MADSPDCWDRSKLARKQCERLRELLAEILPANAFYARKLQSAGCYDRKVDTLADLASFPFTTKAELTADQEAHGPYGTVLTYPRQFYHRLHQTSGTRGRPLRWLDTPLSWQWLLHCWERMYAIAGMRTGERLFFPFSFGPFLGFWTAFDAASQLGYLCLPGGGMSSAARLRFLLDNQPTVVLCTPTYALHLAEVARSEGIDLAKSPVRALIVAGEPGGSIPATRTRIESEWGARVFDHSGLTEVGAACIECAENPGGIHLLEADYIGEVIDPATEQTQAAGTIGELVLTNLGRHGSPLIRYRTGDLVRVDPKPCPCGRTLMRLDGGILGRVDDMIHVRGNNLYPSALEAVIRRFPEVNEYRVYVDQTASMTELRIEIEPVAQAAGTVDARGVAEKVGRAVRDDLLFRAEVRPVAPGTLPRFEMKAQRIVRVG
jgi:phenylacetate-CoA ligase